MIRHLVGALDHRGLDVGAAEPAVKLPLFPEEIILLGVSLVLSCTNFSRKVGFSPARLGQDIHLGSHQCFCQQAGSPQVLLSAPQPSELFWEDLPDSFSRLGFQLSPSAWSSLTGGLLSSLESVTSLAC